MIRYGLITIALGLASAAGAQPAERELPLQTEAVSFADLNLSSAVGQATLQHRIELAAGNVCGHNGMAAMEDFLESAACYRTAYWDGVRQMQKVVASYKSGATLAAAGSVITVAAK
jgi:UrcA family protein